MLSLEFDFCNDIFVTLVFIAIKIKCIFHVKAILNKE